AGGWAIRRGTPSSSVPPRSRRSRQVSEPAPAELIPATSWCCCTAGTRQHCCLKTAASRATISPPSAALRPSASSISPGIPVWEATRPTAITGWRSRRSMMPLPCCSGPDDRHSSTTTGSTSGRRLTTGHSFFRFFRWSLLPQLAALRGQGGLVFVDAGYLVVVLALLQAVVASAILILLPLAWLRRVKKRRTAPSPMRVASYFLLIGLAFLLIEIA